MVLLKWIMHRLTEKKEKKKKRVPRPTTHSQRVAHENSQVKFELLRVWVRVDLSI